METMGQQYSEVMSMPWSRRARIYEQKTQIEQRRAKANESAAQRARQ